jgi:general secretion pathway protein I
LFRRKRLKRAHRGKESGAGAGFTLIEALVALAVVAISLTAIGSLMAANIRGSVRIEQHLGLVETARALATELPGRAVPPADALTGEMAGNAWAIDFLPFPDDFADPRAAKRWVPQRLVMTVRSPSGSILQVDTVRLRQRSAR